MKKFYTVRFNDPEENVQLSATFPKRWQAELYLKGFTSEGYIE